MTERRKFLRFETAINAICEIVADKRKLSSKIRNLSKEGALIELERPLREGEEISLSMDVPGDNIPIVASCQVAWQRESNKEDLYETGVRFVKVGNLDRGRLLEYIYTQWLKILDSI